jgi:hypothetical protein
METRPERPSIRPETVRDRGLRRASALTKWISVGAVALIGTLAGFVAQAKPGRSTGTTNHSAGAGQTPAQSTSAAPVTTGSTAGTAASQTLTPPAAPPAPAPTPPLATSGGS